MQSVALEWLAGCIDNRLLWAELIPSTGCPLFTEFFLLSISFVVDWLSLPYLVGGGKQLLLCLINANSCFQWASHFALVNN